VRSTGAENLIVLLHGRGGTSADLAWLQPFIPEGWRPICAEGPLELGAGHEWFRVPDNPASGPLSHTVAPAADRLVEWIDELAPKGKVALIGYSQGGAVAIQALRRYPNRFELAAVLAGFTSVDSEASDLELANRKPPMFWGRGTDDTVIPASDIVRMQSFLPAHTTLVERVYPGLGHTVARPMAADLARFLRERGTGS
jgi:phospholipase/carboxylesterase